MTVIICPWPTKALWPNGRPNRFVKSREIKAYRRACNILAKCEGVHRMDWAAGKMPLRRWALMMHGSASHGPLAYPSRVAALLSRSARW